MKSFIFFLLTLFVIPLGWSQSPTITVTSLEWPPYTSEGLKDLGASAAVATEAFKVMGYDLKIEFYPWNRAVQMAKQSRGYVGYFPEYYSQEIAADFIYSDPMGSGPLGFVERVDTPIVWSTLEDLKKYVIGTVLGYLNTDEFDALVAQGLIKTEAVVDDATNLAKVANKRMPLAVIDPNVMRFLLKNEKSIIPYRDILQFNDRVLAVKELYMCFKKGPDGEKYVKIFNEGLKRINADQIMRDYFATLSKS